MIREFSSARFANTHIAWTFKKDAKALALRTGWKTNRRSSSARFGSTPQWLNISFFVIWIINKSTLFNKAMIGSENLFRTENLSFHWGWVENSESHFSLCIADRLIVKNCCYSVRPTGWFVNNKAKDMKILSPKNKANLVWKKMLGVWVRAWITCMEK